MSQPHEAHLAAYAIRSAGADERTYPEPEHPWRSPFDLDRHRIIECTAFRRLERKTQVFAPAFHDHFRTRLMHTLEAAHIARRLAQDLLANDLLAEVITLAHDLGHSPFGHAGEAGLDQAMAGHGGFNHNTHALRVVDYLEHPYPSFRGLNLTYETRAGLIAHATRYDMPARGKAVAHEPDADAADTNRGAAGFSPRGGPRGLKPAARDELGEDLPRNPSVEAQISSLADRIAYDCHDLEDAIGAKLVTLSDLDEVGLWQTAYEQIAARHEVGHVFAIRRVVLDAVLNRLLCSAVDTSQPVLGKMTSPGQVRSTSEPLVRLSRDVESSLIRLEDFLLEHVYQHPEVQEMDAEGRRMVLALFDAYLANPDALPARYAARIEEQGMHRVVCDYLAGMTDRFCRAEFERLVKP